MGRNSATPCTIPKITAIQNFNALTPFYQMVFSCLILLYYHTFPGNSSADRKDVLAFPELICYTEVVKGGICHDHS